MKRYLTYVLVLLIIGVLFWAYAAITTLIRDFYQNITFVDLLTIFILGFVAGLGVGLIISFRRKK